MRSNPVIHEEETPLGYALGSGNLATSQLPVVAAILQRRVSDAFIFSLDECEQEEARRFAIASQNLDPIE